MDLIILKPLLDYLFGSLIESAKEQHAKQERLTKEFENSSDALCQCLSNGTNAINANLTKIITSLEKGQVITDYGLLDIGVQLVNELNETKRNLALTLDKFWSPIDNEPPKSDDLKRELGTLLESYAENLQDFIYVSKLAINAFAEISDNNSEFLRSIVHLFSVPKKNIQEIISLRYSDAPLVNYSDEAKRLCNELAEALTLPYKNDSNNSIFPFKALTGDPEDMYQLGTLYWRRGEKKMAYDWLKRAKNNKKGCPKANLALGRLFLKDGNTEAGLNCLQEAANQGDEDSIMELGRYYLDHNQYEESCDCFERLSSKRRDAKFFLARSYDLKNESMKSIDLYSELVGTQWADIDGFSAAAMYHIVEFHFLLKMPEPDMDAVLDFYSRIPEDFCCDNPMLDKYVRVLIPLQKAKIFRNLTRFAETMAINQKFASLNYPAAQYEAAVDYCSDYSLDLQKALEYSSLAASQNYPDAYILLGELIMFASEGGIKKSNIKICINYLKTAAKYGVQRAFEMLRILYAEGYAAACGEGTKQDGIKYERLMHRGYKLYYYVSSLDNQLYRSELKDGAVDEQLIDENGHFWWKSNIIPDFDSLTLSAKEDDDGTFCEGNCRAMEPSCSGVVCANDQSFILTVLRGSIRAEIWEVYYNQSMTRFRPTKLLASTDIAYSDEITSIFAYAQEQAVIYTSLESGTIVRFENIKNTVRLQNPTRIYSEENACWSE